MCRPDRRRVVPLLWLALVAVWVALATPARAQTDDTGPDYLRWDILAELAEFSLTNAETRVPVLESLRVEVSNWRAQFQTAQTQNQDRIAILREQIAALPPPPTDGQAEATDLAERRADLTQRLAQREAPSIAADEAFRRADAIIRSIDRQLRERQAQALLRLWPTPLDPRNWSQGMDALVSSALTVQGEVWNAWLDPDRQAAFWSNLPRVLLALAAALILILRGRAWVEGLTQRLLRSTRLLRGRVVAAFALSLGQIVVPFAGLTLLYFAVVQTGLTSPFSADLAETVIASGLFLVVARWLSLHVFPLRPDPGLALRMDDAARRRGRGAALLLGLCWALNFVYGPFIAEAQQTDAANAVLRFPLIVLAAWGLWRMGGALAAHQALGGPGGPEPRFFDRLVALGSRAALGVALAAPVLAAAGYVPAATQLVFPAIGTLAVVGLVMVLHRLATAIYEAVLGVDEGASDALVPALVGLLLALAALPVIALMWGVRPTDLSDTWTRFQEGFALGGARISPASILAFLVVFALGFLLTRGIQGALSTSVLPKTAMTAGAQKAVVSGLGYLGILIAGLVAFSTAGIDLSGLAIVAGALSLGIGFGLQNIVSNFISGLILLVERPVSEGDWVEVGTTQGIITRISVRSTIIETFDKSEVIVPNADLITGRVTNFTRTDRQGRVIVPITVAYGSDTRAVEALLRDIIEAHPLVTVSPKPIVLLLRFGPDGIEFEIRAILSDAGLKLSVQSDLNHTIARRFAEDGIAIPFAQRYQWQTNADLAAQAAAQASRRAAEG